MCLRASGEDYLKSVLVLRKQNGAVRSADLALYMGYSRASICHAVGVLCKGGFLTVNADRFLDLTDVGREVAEDIYQRYSFFRDLLMGVGVNKETAEQEACRMEHTISQDTFGKIRSAYQEKSESSD